MNKIDPKKHINRRLLLQKIDVTGRYAFEARLIEVTEKGYIKLCQPSPKVAGEVFYYWEELRNFEVVEVLADDKAEYIRTAVAVYELLEALRESPASSVTILCDNEEADTTKEQCAVEISAEWTNWLERRFYGKDIQTALMEALGARSAATSSNKS